MKFGPCQDSGQGSGFRSLLLIAAISAFVSPAAAEADPPAAPAPPHRPPRRHAGATLEDRVRTLTQALGLDERQQAGVRQALQDQRDWVSRVGSDVSVSGPDRVTAVQAIGDRTAERIRALLNDEQKKKYFAPRPKGLAPGESPPMEAWIDAVRSR